ncbi:hypothetical protein GLUCOINTEAF2_0202895 [Komagataeibacter intermedius AF2]|uniref:Uncharacterized protein n=1 Tax=Komagataeibacter intermedius AF2 TaxID=1458464 RepID=A0A0N1FN38_9PROT|nr:hypothetical protein GLUCOINTEAF2_0202895 [Komagataeibacter intermedius AF2]
MVSPGMTFPSGTPLALPSAFVTVSVSCTANALASNVVEDVSTV